MVFHQGKMVPDRGNLQLCQQSTLFRIQIITFPFLTVQAQISFLIHTFTFPRPWIFLRFCCRQMNEQSLCSVNRALLNWYDSLNNIILMCCYIRGECSISVLHTSSEQMYQIDEGHKCISAMASIYIPDGSISLDVVIVVILSLKTK